MYILLQLIFYNVCVSDTISIFLSKTKIAISNKEWYNYGGQTNREVKYQNEYFERYVAHRIIQGTSKSDG